MSAFIASTCQLIPKSSLVLSDAVHNLVASKDPSRRHYSVMSGSYAEFYIRPVITCIGDVDYIIHLAHQLVDEDIPVLPSDIRGLPDTIECYKIEPYQNYPGFVRIRFDGEMIYNWNYNKYEFHSETGTNSYIKMDLDGQAGRYSYLSLTVEHRSLPNIVSGPAIKKHSADNAPWNLGIDFVKSLWCPQWPKEAKGWLIRPRKHGWPTTDTISEVVQDGCHFVYVQNRSCRDDEAQRRFSFSVAEVTLLQSWTQTQQIVYHLLRFFAKRELMHKDCPKENE